jgi:DNA invertase Pin-like site-specific DNA recombinase
MSGTEPLDTSTATGRLMLSVIGAIGQAKREAMLEPQREGIAKAKLKVATRAACRPS